MVNGAVGLRHLFAPELSALGREPMTATVRRFGALDAASRPMAETFSIPLDGSWEFHLVDHPDSAPPGWTTGDDEAEWQRLAVPGCWTRQGVDDLPHYTNIVMPWPELDPPAVPDQIPTGLYRRSVVVPDKWRGRQILLSIGGAESMAIVWCNGTFVGMGKDARLESRFDLTPYLLEGTNRLAVMVPRWSDATWIEDQDHWWHGGLHRSVTLVSKPVVAVDDVWLAADWDHESETGELSVTTMIRRGGGGFRTRTTLFSSSMRRIAKPVEVEVDAMGRDRFSQELLTYSHGGTRTTARFENLAVHGWSAERPTLYRVVIELLDADGTVVDIVSTTTGFRRIEIVDRQLRINGQPIVLCGVNRHDHDPDTGKVVTRTQMRAELVEMKRHNVNAIRCAHYPNDPALLDMCDEIGLYVLDEANVESHARLRSLTSGHRYDAAIMERVQRMVQRDRNHPCVIGWSLGNESGFGAVHQAAASWVRAVDPTRFVHYEGAVQERFSLGQSRDLVTEAPTDAERITTDVVCPMYLDVDRMVEWARWANDTHGDDRPMVLCEFSHAMGNSNGSLGEYFAAFFSQPALAGGFVWDWRDQGLAEVSADGTKWWAYGGHYGDEPNDVNFCINGLVGPDGTPHPALREFKWAARPFTIEPRGEKIRVTNRLSFRAASDFKIHWDLVLDDVVVESGIASLTVGPQASVLSRVPYKSEIPKRTRAYLNVEWRLAANERWAKAGHVVAWDQIELQPAPQTAVRLRTRGALAHTVIDGMHTVRAGDIKVSVADNGFRGIWCDATALIEGDICGWLWRAPTDNDGIRQGPSAPVTGVRNRWLSWGLDALGRDARPVRVRHHAGGVLIILDRSLIGTDATARHLTRCLVTRDGLQFDERFTIPHEWDDLPRVGVRFVVSERRDRLSWRGLGPDESYPDRCGAQLQGWWSSFVDDQYVPYVVPQEHGAHFATEWFGLTDRDGVGVRIDAAPGERIVATARPHHDGDLSAATTLADLHKSPGTEVHVDAAVRGLGTAACGPDTRPEFRIESGIHEFTWFLRPQQ